LVDNAREDRPSKMATELSQVLGRMPLFEGLDDEQRRAFLTRARRRSLDPGQTLFLQGDKADGLFVVLQGRVKVFKTSPRGREQILMIMTEGDPIGEVAVLSGEVYPAGAEALEEAEVLCIPRQAFLDLVRQDPEVAMRLLGALSARLRSFATLIEDLSLRDVAQRLAAHLLVLADRTDEEQEVELTVSKSQLSSAVGTVPETLSRAFRQLAEVGAIETHGRKVRIRNRQILQKMAGRR